MKDNSIAFKEGKEQGIILERERILKILHKYHSEENNFNTDDYFNIVEKIKNEN
jgi:hypothetical protein